tara:strand:- start:596 stop:2125 length:1530 start_codon:yes stop_codon:yes gene_type:complete
MIIENNILSTLWIQGELDDLTKLCLESWVNLGYSVNLYTYEIDKMESNHPNIFIKDAEEICTRYMIDYAPQADLFRYNLALKYQKEKRHYIWIDSDMFLLRRFPNDINIISSEHTKKVGAFKSKKDYVPNIGLLQFLPNYNEINWEKILNKCEKSNDNQNSNRNNYMKIFQKEIKDLNIIIEPNAFCPVSWANYKELYQRMTCESKFGMNVVTDFYQLINLHQVFGVHLWRNLKNKNNVEVHSDSLFSKLSSINKLRKYKVFVPTYRRKNLLEKTTLDYLTKSFILKEQIYLVIDKEDKSYQTLDYQKIICPEKGIGAVRSWILNKCFFVNHGDTIIMIDDDIEHFINSLSQKVYLDQMIPMTVDKMIKEDCYFGGFPLCSNPFFLKEKYTTNLVYVSGACQIHRIDRTRTEVKTHLKQYEDYHFNIQYFLRDTKYLRNNRFAPITNHYNPVGGICETYGDIKKRLEDCKISGDWLVEEYPLMCELYWKKGSARVPPSYNIKLNTFFTF